MIFRHALLDRFPAGGDADRHQEHGEHDQHQRDAVDAERPLEAAEQIGALDELPLRPADLVGHPQADAERRGRRASSPARSSARLSRPVEQAGERTEQRESEDRREDRKARHRAITQVVAAATAEQHHQRIGVEIAGLEAGGDLRAGDDRRGGAVRAEAVDRALIAALPEQPAEPDGRADEQDVVELVEVPFVEEEQVEQPEIARRKPPGRRCCGCKRRRRSRSRAASPSSPTASPRAALRASRAPDARRRRRCRPRNAAPPSASMKAWWKTKPASSAPSASRPSGTSIVHGLSCG